MRPGRDALALAASLALASCSPPAATSSPALYDLRGHADVVTWDDGGAVSRFVYLHPSEIFPAAIVRRAGAVRELSERPRPEVGDFPVELDGGNRASLRDVVANRYDGLIVVARGAVVYEQYPRMAPSDVHLAFSVTKAFVGTLLGMLEDTGEIDLEQPVDAYLPELAGSAWAGTRLRDVADMASGIEGVEDSSAAYLDSRHKHFQMEAALGWQPRSPDMRREVLAGDAYAFLRTLSRIAPAGTAQKYTSINTLVLADLIERVTGERLADALSDRIWSRIGAEGDALFLVNEKGFPISHGGMAMRLRDLARFGMAFVDAEQSGDRSVLPKRFVDRLCQVTRPEIDGSRKHPDWADHSSYQFDELSRSGVLVKGGFAGQLLYVDRARGVVVATFGTNTTIDDEPPRLPVHALVDALFPSVAAWRGP